MKTLVETSLFNLFASYTNGAGPALGELPAAYDDFVNCLATLSPAGDLTGQLRCLNYTKIELAFMRQACNGMAEDCRNIKMTKPHRKKKKKQVFEPLVEQNDDFFFIAGYTSGGAPYGVTWEEMGLEPWEELV